jgi:hypothetical protein
MSVPDKPVSFIASSLFALIIGVGVLAIGLRSEVGRVAVCIYAGLSIIGTIMGEGIV